MQTTSRSRTCAARIEQTGPGYRPLTKVVLLALRSDGRVALVRRARFPDEGQLALVGGRLQPAEWLDEAACRGASRILGIRVGVQDIELSGLLHYRSERGAGRLCAVFATQRWSGDPRNTAPGEYNEVVWADPGGPPADCRPLTHAVLNLYVAGTLYSTLAMPAVGPDPTEDAAVLEARSGVGTPLPASGAAGPFTTNGETTSAARPVTGDEVSRETNGEAEQATVSDSERLLFGGELAYDIGWDQHEGAWLKLGMWTMAKGLPRMVATGLRLAHLADARALRVVLGAEVGRGIAQAVGLVAVNAVLGHILAGGGTNERLASAFPSLAVVAVAALVGSLLRSASTAATGELEPKVQRVATEQYLGLVHRVELAAIEDDEFHRLLDAARYGADSARRMIRYCTNTLNSGISLVAAAGVLTVLHIGLLPLLVLMTLPSGWRSLTISRQHYVSFHAFVQHARAGHLLGQLLTQREAAAEVRVHEVGPFLLGHFREMAETSEREQTRLARSAAKIGLIADGASGVATLLTYGALGLLLWSGRMDLAVAGTAVLAIRTGSSSLDGLVLQMADLHQESLFVADFERLCTEAKARAIPQSGEDLPEQVREVRFEKVTFTYPGSGDLPPEPTLREVSLSFPIGKVIALVGANGSGKSTVVKLLAGLHQPDPGGGTIWWDDVDAAAAERSQIFARVGLMSQSFFRWPFTVRVNIGIGNPALPIDDRAVREAAEFSGADRFIAGLRRELSTLLGRGYRGGQEASGGEWQMIGIARAWYKRAQILVVDEPTSALDAVAEQRVFDQIRALAAAGQTVVLITHRLHSVRHADVIHVMKDGRLAESGTFSELMDDTTGTGTGDFRTAYRIQAAAFADTLPGPRAESAPATAEEEVS